MVQIPEKTWLRFDEQRGVEKLWLVFSESALPELDSLKQQLGSSMGLPLSTTQVLVGAVIGVGLARGIAGLNLTVIKKITGSWIFTIPTTGLVSAALSWVWFTLRS